jgi:hypothetical protein
MELTQIIDMLLPYLSPILAAYSGDMGPVLQIVSISTTLRAVNKPLFSAAHKFAESTETSKDDELIAKIESNKFYKALSFALDYLASVKMQSVIKIIGKAKKK